MLDIRWMLNPLFAIHKAIKRLLGIDNLEYRVWKLEHPAKFKSMDIALYEGESYRIGPHDAKNRGIYYEWSYWITNQWRQIEVWESELSPNK